jgi:hypothetical protein
LVVRIQTMTFSKRRLAFATFPALAVTCGVSVRRWVLISNSLNDGPFSCTSLTKLSGGTANFVYRGILGTPLSDGEDGGHQAHWGLCSSKSCCEWRNFELQYLNYDMYPIRRNSEMVMVSTRHLI